MPEIDILAKIQKLVERASHPGTPEAERDACLAKADAMMTKYAIDTAMLDLAKPAASREHPTSVDISFVSRDDPNASEMHSLLHRLCEYNRVKAAFRTWQGTAILVGFQADIDYVRQLWTGIYLAFTSKINPQWDSALSAQENIKILKEAGRKWGYIAELANKNGFECTPNDGRLKAAYQRQCKAEGVPPTAHTQRHEAYRASFTEGFVEKVSQRLYRQHSAAQETVSATPGSAIALRDRFDDVLSRFYEMFPSLRPMSDEEFARRMKDLNEAEKARLAAMTPAQRAAEERRNARARAQSQARWERENARMQDAAGRQAGTAAGAVVDLGGGKVSGTSVKGIQG